MSAIAKLSSEYGVTLPEWAVEALGHPTHVDISVEGDRLVFDVGLAVTAEQVFEKLRFTLETYGCCRKAGHRISQVRSN